MRQKLIFTSSFILKVILFIAVLGFIIASDSDSKQEHYKIRSFDYPHIWDKDSDIKITKE